MEFGSFLGNDALKTRLHAAFSEEKILHSYALCGPAGSGRHTLARQMAAAMQCTGEGRLPCGVCAACRKVMGNVHPDVITVNDPEHKMISVDVIREMRADVFLRPNEGKRKIYILEQDMGEPAQNALLKILEEPPVYGVFLILTTNAEKLLPTIRSRCAQLHLGPVPQEEGIRWLQKNGPELPASAFAAALHRSGGYLGPALALLQQESEFPQARQFAECYAACDTLALLRLLLPMEKLKRDQLIPILTRMREVLLSALEVRSGLPEMGQNESAILRSRTPVQILQAANDLQTAVDDLGGNVSVGAVIGWLTIRLR